MSVVIAKKADWYCVKAVTNTNSKVCTNNIIKIYGSRQEPNDCKFITIVILFRI